MARAEFIDRILSEIPLAEFGLEEARTHARLWAELAVNGEMIGAHELLIGATALTLGFRVATSNLRDFGRIPGLRVEFWGRKP